MKHLIALIAITTISCATVSEPRQPLQSGNYTFQHRFAEHPDMQSFQLTAKINGNHIVLINNEPSNAFPKGVVAEGTLMWHSRSRQWVIGNSNDDRDAVEVGGCSDGPEVVDLQGRTYWTC